MGTGIDDLLVPQQVKHIIPQCLHHRLERTWLVTIWTPGLQPPTNTSLVPAATGQQIPIVTTEYQHRYEDIKNPDKECRTYQITGTVV